MNHANRLAETWSPNWDLGLQDEFDFGGSAPAPVAKPEAPRSGWPAASAQTLEARAGFQRRVAPEGASVGELIAFFEALYNSVSEGEGHE